MKKYDSRAGTARVTISLPGALLKAVDALARRERRTRSWAFSEALRLFLASGDASGDRRRTNADPHPHAGLFELARLDRLASDLALTAEERVLQAEELADTAVIARPQPRLHQLIAFESRGDYLAWKRTETLR